MCINTLSYTRLTHTHTHTLVHLHAHAHKNARTPKKKNTHPDPYQLPKIKDSLEISAKTCRFIAIQHISQTTPFAAAKNGAACHL